MKNRILSIGILLVFGLIGNIKLQAKSSCIANIQKRLDVIGTDDFSIHKAREIIREFDFGNVQEFNTHPGKRLAFKKVFESLSDFIDLAPNSLSGSGMSGFVRIAGGIIRSNGADYVDDLIEVFGGRSNLFDAEGFTKVMEHLNEAGKWLGQTEWESAGGLLYSLAPPTSHGHRIIHVFSHSIDNPSKPVHSVFALQREGVLGLIDEGWKSPNKRHPVKPNGTPDTRVWEVDMGRIIGSAGERHLKIVVGSAGSNVLITAFPFVP